MTALRSYSFSLLLLLLLLQSLHTEVFERNWLLFFFKIFLNLFLFSCSTNISPLSTVLRMTPPTVVLSLISLGIHCANDMRKVFLQ